MANLQEQNAWEAGIYQLEETDPVQGGPEGIDNRQAKQLANRTRYLKAIVDSLWANLNGHASAADPHPQYMTESEVSVKISAAVNSILNGAGGALDTLKELADALGNDANFAATVNAAIAARLTQAQGDSRYLTPAGGDSRYLTPSGGDSRYVNKSTSNTITTVGANNQTYSGQDWSQLYVSASGTGVGVRSRNAQVLGSVPNAYYIQDIVWLGDKAIVHKTVGTPVPEVYEDANRHIWRNQAGVEQLVCDDTSLYYKGQDLIAAISQSSNQSLNQNGYKVFQGAQNQKLVLQWGALSRNSSFVTHQIALPLAFLDSPLILIPVTYLDGRLGASANISFSTITNSSFVVNNAVFGDGGYSTLEVKWLAIGTGA